MNFKSTFTK